MVAMPEGIEVLETALRSLLAWLRLGVEAAAALWVGVGFVYAFIELVAAHLRRRTASFKAIRLTFSRYLSLALEFQLAADILSTTMAPTFDELSKLAITAAIRTGLNFFLSREILEFAAEHEREARITTSVEAPMPAGARTVPT
jgi:uncharacterized membrane protein